MLDFNRSSKLYCDPVMSFQSLVPWVPSIEPRAYWDNQTVGVRVLLPNEVLVEPLRHKIRWELNTVCGYERVEIPTVGHALYGSIRVPMPRVACAGEFPLSLTLLDCSGHELARCCEQLLILPSRAAPARFSGGLAILTASGREAMTAQQLNYTVESELTERAQVVVCDYPNLEVMEWVSQGGRLLYICEGDQPRLWRWGTKRISDGHLMASSSWLDADAYPNLPLANPANLPVSHIFPTRGIADLPLRKNAFDEDILAGEMLGWVQRPHVHSIQFRYGHGRVIMTTYTLLESFRSDQADPFAVVMFNDLIEYLASERCNPTLVAD